MRALLTALCSMAAVSVVIHAADGQDFQGPSFFPTRPPHVVISSVHGTLIGWGYGNKAASLELRADTAKPIHFNLADSVTIDGVVIDCAYGPSRTFTPPPGSCPIWPRYVVVGKSKVTVKYWHQVDPDGRKVLVTQTILTDHGALNHVTPGSR
jgi:hypothetical protein